MPPMQIRHHLRMTVNDCHDLCAQRVIHKIEMTKTVGDLWLLRSDWHQCIAQLRSESVAAERINALVLVFRDWLPGHQLVRI